MMSSCHYCGAVVTDAAPRVLVWVTPTGMQRAIVCAECEAGVFDPLPLPGLARPATPMYNSGTT